MRNKKVEASHKGFKAELEQLQKNKEKGTNVKSAKITREYKNAFNGVAISFTSKYDRRLSSYRYR